MNKHDQCGLCGLIGFVVRRTWNLNERPHIDIAGITCELHSVAIGKFGAYECSDIGIPDGVLPARRNVCHRLRITTSGAPNEVVDALKAARVSYLPEIQLLEEDAFKVGRTKELHGRRVGETVDIGLLKRWIHTCENEHRENCETAWWRDPGEVLLKNARVLDVSHMAIVPAPRSCRYVALSYIWGGIGAEYWTTQANLKQRSRRGGLDISMLPATIQDIIQLVRQLGEQYLWIDTLCIVQDDTNDKAKQIGAMELIYGFSVFTIFAAGGTSVRDPLPGFRPGTRDPNQQIAKIQGLHLAVPLILPHEAIASSAWNMRGWTYQELMLSRRRIFFTSHYVFFECQKDVFGEDIAAEPINFPWSSHPLWYSNTGKFMALHRVPSRKETGREVRFMRHGTATQSYMMMVGDYTLRRLTLESDVVNAITALLNAMTKGYKLADGHPNKAFRFGMPIFDLEHGLLWQPTANAIHEKRVPADGNRIPSWSWAAWRGAVRYDGGEVLVRKNRSSLPYIQESLVEQWYIVDDNGKLVRQDTRHTGQAGDEAHRAIYITPKGDIDAQQLISKNVSLRPGTLVFRTSSARFDVTKTDDILQVGADAKANYTIYSILSDISRASTRVGRVILPCSIRSPTSFEFVVLSRTGGRPGLFDEDRLDEYGMWKRLGYHGCMFHVMAVQKMRDEEVMERVGLGVIFDRAWVNSSAEQKIVLLG